MPVRSTTGSANDYPAGQSAASGVQNGGSVINAGSNAAGIFTRNLSLVEIADEFGGVIGSKVVANDGTGASTTDRAGVDKAVSGGTLAYNASATEWVMRGVSTTLGGVANDVLLSKGEFNNGVVRDNIHGTIADRKLGSDADAAFNKLARPSTQIVPGRTKGTGAGNANTFVNPADGTAAVASEIFPSRSVPGELTYNFGAPNPTTDEYKAKDSYES